MAFPADPECPGRWALVLLADLAGRFPPESGKASLHALVLGEGLGVTLYTPARHERWNTVWLKPEWLGKRPTWVGAEVEKVLKSRWDTELASAQQKELKSA